MLINSELYKREFEVSSTREFPVVGST